MQRRARSEIKDLVAQFADSGLNQSEYCQRHGLCRGTLYRHLKRLRQASVDKPEGGLVAVELAGGGKLASDGCALAVVLSERRRIEVGAGFDAPTLARLVMLLEKL